MGVHNPDQRNSLNISSEEKTLISQAWQYNLDG